MAWLHPQFLPALHPQNDPEMSEEQYQEWKAQEITGWDASFIDVDLKTLFDMILVGRPLTKNNREVKKEKHHIWLKLVVSAGFLGLRL